MEYKKIKIYVEGLNLICDILEIDFVFGECLFFNPETNKATKVYIDSDNELIFPTKYKDATSKVVSIGSIITIANKLHYVVIARFGGELYITRHPDKPEAVTLSRIFEFDGQNKINVVGHLLTNPELLD